MNEEMQVLVRQPTSPARAGLESMLDTARALCRSGLLPRSFDTPEKVVAAWLVARELGLGVGALLRRELYVGEWGVALVTRAMLALILRSGKIRVSYDVADDGDTVSCTMQRLDGTDISFTSVWNDARVETAGCTLDRHGQLKPAWKHYRQQMKLHRAISEAAQFVAADLIGRVYVPDELDVTEEGVYNVLTGEMLPAIETDDSDAEAAERAHWIDDPDTRARFWQYVREELALNDDDVHSALGVGAVHEYTGSKRAALEAIRQYVAQRIAESEAEPAQEVT